MCIFGGRMRILHLAEEPCPCMACIVFAGAMLGLHGPAKARPVAIGSLIHSKNHINFLQHHRRHHPLKPKDLSLRQRQQTMLANGTAGGKP